LRVEVFTVVKVQVEVFWLVTPRRWRQQGPPKRWYPTTTLHGITTQKTMTWIKIKMAAQI